MPSRDEPGPANVFLTCQPTGPGRKSRPSCRSSSECRRTCSSIRCRRLKRTERFGRETESFRFRGGGRNGRGTHRRGRRLFENAPVEDPAIARDDTVAQIDAVCDVFPRHVEPLALVELIHRVADGDGAVQPVGLVNGRLVVDSVEETPAPVPSSKNVPHPIKENQLRMLKRLHYQSNEEG